MPRPMHFEIQVDDMDRAQAFYTEVFGWAFEDYSHFTGSPYLGVTTGPDEEAGINGGMLLRQAAAAGREAAPNAFVLTVVVENYDETMERIFANGGEQVSPKAALPGMAWQGYYTDTEGNVFGIHEPDTSAA